MQKIRANGKTEGRMAGIFRLKAKRGQWKCMTITSVKKVGLITESDKYNAKLSYRTIL